MSGRVIIAVLAAALLLAPPAGWAQPAAPSTPATKNGERPAGTSGGPAGDRFGVDLASAANPSGASIHPYTVSTLGAGWVRLTANWDALEPGRGKFAWEKLDAAIRQAAAEGERVLITLQRTPKWASLTPDSSEAVWSHQPPRSMADWSAFMRAVVSRYRGRVAAWQIQPALEFGVFRGTTRDYLDMLRTARLEARQADRAALVVAAAPPGLDLAFLKFLFGTAGNDFDALMLLPRGRPAGALIEALGALRARGIATGKHELWLSARNDWPQPVQLAVTALALGIAREFWQAPTPAVVTVLHQLGEARFVGPLDRGPGVYAFVFANGDARTAVLWTDGETRSVPLATTGVPVLTGADGQARPGGQSGTITVGPGPVFVATPAAQVLEEASNALAAGPVTIRRDPSRDFSRADNVTALLGAPNVERGLYNQELRSLPSGAVVPVTVDGVSAIRTDQQKDAVYVYFAIDSSYAYFVDGRYDYLITVDVHRAGGPQRVGFNVMYDSMSGYRFSSWQWVDDGPGWASYTIRIPDASFSKTWGWDFAINGAADKKENLVVRAVTVTRVPAGQATR